MTELAKNSLTSTREPNLPSPILSPASLFTPIKTRTFIQKPHEHAALFLSSFTIDFRGHCRRKSIVKEERKSAACSWGFWMNVRVLIGVKREAGDKIGDGRFGSLVEVNEFFANF